MAVTQPIGPHGSKRISRELALWAASRRKGLPCRGLKSKKESLVRQEEYGERSSAQQGKYLVAPLTVCFPERTAAFSGRSQFTVTGLGVACGQTLLRTDVLDLISPNSHRSRR